MICVGHPFPVTVDCVPLLIVVLGEKSIVRLGVIGLILNVNMVLLRLLLVSLMVMFT